MLLHCHKAVDSCLARYYQSRTTLGQPGSGSPWYERGGHPIRNCQVQQLQPIKSNLRRRPIGIVPMRRRQHRTAVNDNKTELEGQPYRQKVMVAPTVISLLREPSPLFLAYIIFPLLHEHMRLHNHPRHSPHRPLPGFRAL